MRHFALLLFLFAFGLALPACAQKVASKTQKVKVKKAKSSTKPVAAAKPAAEESPVITFERTPCFGTCPAYRMQVFADGRVLYEGRRGVPFVGQKELRLSKAAVDDLLRQAKEAHFDQFAEQYTQHTTDLPSTIIGVRQANGQLKVVRVEEGEPENVRQLVTYFGHQFDPLVQSTAADR
ncbi:MULTISPECIES: DUF6438 domain-containing protein [Hymenobacter]|uniref:DUF6438 domain-containing protein n=1 Tax=Hymenobacter armeniacus TaxID=2771358 RepID=A0ABR8JVY5_9BACT|nr:MULTISPECIES: DUF6438 domain-containing protein [Hymenobacter]MBD2724028.1 hypothetical protein [Hymenobacter armeniacus]MBJ6110218.1 hypothetical protein [Hymenobacter sp. BT523]